MLNLVVLLAMTMSTAACDSAPGPAKQAEVAASPVEVAPAKMPPERIVPSFKDDKPYGLKLYAMRPESRFLRAGCQAGDTVIAVDGEAISDAESLRKMMGSLQSGGGAKLTIVRAGVPLPEPLVLQR